MKGDHLIDKAALCSGKYGISESSYAYAVKIFHYIFYYSQDIYAVTLGYYVSLATNKTECQN